MTGAATAPSSASRSSDSKIPASAGSSYAGTSASRRRWPSASARRRATSWSPSLRGARLRCSGATLRDGGRMRAALREPELPPRGAARDAGSPAGTDEAVRWGLALVLAVGLALRAWSVSLSPRRAAHRRAGRPLPPGGSQSPVLQLAQPVHVRDGRGLRARLRRLVRRGRGGVRQGSRALLVVGRLVTALFGTATVASITSATTARATPSFGRAGASTRSAGWRASPTSTTR